VIGAERLHDTGAIDTTSISQQTAGFITTNLGAARNKIMLRGLSDGTFTGRTQQTVGTYLDNIPLTYNAPDPDLRLIDVDRVEVLRGPQGALYGGGSLSGVYRIVSTKPVLDEWSGSALAGAAPPSPARPAAAWRACSTCRWSPTGPPSGWRPMTTSTAAMSTTSICAFRTSTAPRAPAAARPCRWRSNDGWSILVSGARQDLHATDSQYTTPNLGGQRRANQVRETHDNVLQQGAVTITGAGRLGPVRVVDGLCPPSVRQPVRRHRGAERRRRRLGRRRPVRRGQQGAAAGRGRGAVVARHRIAFAGWSGSMAWPASRTATASCGLARSTILRGLIYLEARRDRRRELASTARPPTISAAAGPPALGGRAFRSEVHTTSMVEAPAPGQSRALDRQARFTGVSPKFSLQRTWGKAGWSIC
jgi:iron complex outermembrane receptor protein